MFRFPKDEALISRTGFNLEMMQAGADLIEIYSAFIYSGPAVLKEMARAWMKDPR